MSYIFELLTAGLMAMREYVALHVVTCLIPAFLLAGAIVTFISKEAIIKYLGYAANKLRSFTLASFGSFFVAACSCTVIPVASGLYYGGSSIGAAFIVLWVAPATNILALIYTGAVIGYKMAIVRVVSALIMAFIVGIVMVTVFRKEEEER
ncbi:MAG: permease, partial [Candidatus Margulisiibacteriota bacterium]